MSQTIVIKIGGVASQQLSQEFLNQVKAWKNEGHRLVIVHGGGFAINKLICQQRMFGIVGDQTQFFHFAEQWNDLTADCPMSKK